MIVDILTKSVHFLRIKISYNLSMLAGLYIREVIRLHGTLVSIVLDRDLRFTLRFWLSLQKTLSTRLKFSTSFYPQTDRQSERIM